MIINVGVKHTRSNNTIYMIYVWVVDLNIESNKNIHSDLMYTGYTKSKLHNLQQIQNRKINKKCIISRVNSLVIFLHNRR